ncbi:MAG TPA: hypothetical protein VJ909_00030, partial [Prolixibacteraceae bacterium]|nr:hypothetical protein [Prolixibacteraceae bacterium]
MSYFKKHKEGIIITVVYHAVIALLLFFMGFYTPLPLPQEKGVLVDFGDSETGIGKQEPAPEPEPQPQQQQPQTQEQVTPPPPPEPADPVVAEKQPDESGEDVMTQDFEETAAIDEAKRKEEEEARKKR